MSTNTFAAAGHYIATEIAWHGSAGDDWIARKLAAAGYDVDAAKVAEFAVTEGLLKEIPRLGGYTAGRKVNAAEFGEKFADFMAGQEVTVCATCGEFSDSVFWRATCSA